jgi:hypothetical protein
MTKMECVLIINAPDLDPNGIDSSDSAVMFFALEGEDPWEEATFALWGEGVMLDELSEEGL